MSFTMRLTSGRAEFASANRIVNDIKRAKQILAYPWFKGKKPWEKEIKKMIRNGFKMEVEAMISKSLSYLTEEYLPRKLKKKSEWLD